MNLTAADRAEIAKIFLDSPDSIRSLQAFPGRIGELARLAEQCAEEAAP